MNTFINMFSFRFQVAQERYRELMLERLEMGSFLKGMLYTLLFPKK